MGEHSVSARNGKKKSNARPIFAQANFLNVITYHSVLYEEQRNGKAVFMALRL